VNQSKTFKDYYSGCNLVLHGYAGTGKTFCALYLALAELLEGQSMYERIIIIRSAVPSRDMGFMPGSLKEKMQMYEEPYREICDDLFDSKNAYDFLKMKGIVQFCSSSFLRGITFNNCIVIVDEAENFTFPEIDTVITRMGNDSRLVICGDFRQTDLHKPHEKEGITQCMNIIRKMDCFSMVEFEKQDIVRSGLVKSYIITKADMGL
jgi:phosphate starvation-inducible protein PhoH